MFRDFSQEAKEKLISYVNDTSSDGIWQIIKNSIDYMDVKIKNWLHTLDSYAYLSQMDGYYQTVLNKPCFLCRKKNGSLFISMSLRSVLLRR